MVLFSIANKVWENGQQAIGSKSFKKSFKTLISIFFIRYHFIYLLIIVYRMFLPVCPALAGLKFSLVSKYF